MKKYALLIITSLILKAEELTVRYSYSPESGDILPTIKMPIYLDSEKERGKLYLTLF